MSGSRSSERPPSGTSSRTFPMRVVTRMTGLSADVVRVWERRYAAITPDRTDGNARRYSGR
jgi:DNA-binding transcriptional MerR regulator